MTKSVRFKDEVEYEPETKAPLVRAQKLTDMTFDGLPPGLPYWASAIIALFLIVFLVVWIMGLVRMGKCGGRKCWLWWCTIFIPLFVPGIGQLWGLVVGILALTMLRNGGKLLTMQCPQ